MAKIMGLDDLVHFTHPEDPSRSLCPDEIPLCGADSVNPEAGLPVTCPGCQAGSKTR